MTGNEWPTRQATAESGVTEWDSEAGKGVGRDAGGLLGKQAAGRRQLMPRQAHKRKRHGGGDGLGQPRAAQLC